MPVHLGLAIGILFTLIFGLGSLRAQDAPKESAMRLPDGTIIFYTKNPNDAAPVIDGVLLSAKEYQQLLDQSDQLKKSKAKTPPQPPSVCNVRCQLKTKTDHPTATLTITYQFKTTTSGSAILLGGQKAFAVKAVSAEGGSPVLESTPDGLVALIDRPGEHSLTVTFEAPATVQNKGETGFEISLPRAAITTLAVAAMTPELKTLSLGTRLTDASGKVMEVKTVSADPRRFLVDSTGTGVPLGPTDLLALSWDSPGTVPTPTPTENTLDIDANIRVDERSVETTALLKLRGPNREWSLMLPPRMTLTIHGPMESTKLTAPTDPKSNIWTVSLPAGAMESALMASLKQARPDAKTPANFHFGPLAAKGPVRTGGTLRVYAPLNIRFAPKDTADLRRVDVPVAAEDTPTAIFRFANLTNLDQKTTPLLEYELRPATGFVASQAQHKLTLTPLGWRIRSEFRIAPIRTALEQVTLELPVGWQDPTFAPLDLVDEVQGGGVAATTRALTLRLVAPQREPFVLTLDARYLLNADVREASLPLPRLTSARERDTTVSVAVPEPFEVKGTLREWDGNKAAVVVSDFNTATARTLSGQYDGSVARVDVAWQPAKPRFHAEIVSDVILSDRQAVITQTIKLSFPEGSARHVKFAGATNLIGFRSTPMLESTGPGDWAFTAPGTKDVAVTLSFAVPWKADQPVPFVWPETSTINSTVRIGGTTTGRRVVGFHGPWRESAPEASPDRDTLPWLTVTGTGAELPLTLTWANADIAGSVVIDRAVHQWWLTRDDPPQARSRFLLKRWPALLEIETPADGLVSVFVDRQRVEPVLMTGATLEARTFGIPMPDSKATRTSLLIEIRYRGATGDKLIPVSLKGSITRNPDWWQIVPPPRTLPLTFGNLQPEIGWHWQDGLLQPSAGISDANFDKWLTDAGELEATPGDHSITGRQTRPTPVEFLGVPRFAAFVGGTILMLVLGIGLQKIPSHWIAPLVAFSLVNVVTAAYVWPQPLSQLAYAVQPGLVVAIVVLGGTAALSSWRKNRAARLATFRRGTPPPMPSVPSLDFSSKPSRAGSSTAAPPVPSNS